jgi:recombination protein RecT
MTTMSTQTETERAPLPPALLEQTKLPAAVRPVAQILAAEPIERRLRSLLHGTGLTVDKLRRVVIEQVTRNPRLGEQKRLTNLLLAICDSAKLGLLPDGVLGTGALVPHGQDDVQFRPMYKGLLKLTYQSGLIAAVNAVIVYEGEPFVLERGLEQKLEHKVLPPSQRGEPLGCYVVATWRDGKTKTWDFMWKEEIEALRDRYSDAYNSTMEKVHEGKLKLERAKNPWITEPLEMWKKTVLRRVLKALPSDTTPYMAAQMDEFSESTGAAVHLGRSIHDDDAIPSSDYREDDGKTFDGSAERVETEKSGAPARVAAAVGAGRAEPEPEPTQEQAGGGEDGGAAPDPKLFAKIELPRKGKVYDWRTWRAEFAARLARMQDEAQVAALCKANDETIQFLTHLDQAQAAELSAEVTSRIEALAAE